LILDLAEAAAGGMGPHGILVGATGSGKSELLRSLAAGLAVRHDPDVLQLLLVDYKGGAAFAGLGGLPHVAGLVTNLAEEPDLIGRVQAALGGELERRQRLLRDAGNLNSIGELHRQGGPAAADMAYLVVVVDEFGELLVAEPGFADTFNAIGRLGRSLGIHLLLATQRLDEGRIRTLEPHLRYRIALRTYTSGESRAVLGSPAAHELAPVPGLGYLKVDERTLRFKSAISTLPERPSVEPAAGELLRPLSVHWAAQSHSPAAVEEGQNQLEVLVQAVVARHRTRARRVWTDPLPAAVTLGALPQPATGGGVAVGVVDLPAKQRREPLLWDPWALHGNLGIAGGPRTGKSMLLATVVLATVNADPSCQVYCLDLAGGGLRALEGLPQVGAMIGPGEPETAARLVGDLRTLVAERAALHPDARARLPMVLAVVDGTGLLRQTQPELETAIAALATTGLAQRVHVLAAANRWFDVRPQLLDALNVKWELALGDPSETVFERAAAKALPVGRPGRGLTRAGTYFQGALPSWQAVPDPLGPEADLAHAIEQAASDPRAIPAPRVASLPMVVHEADLAPLAVAAGSSPPDPEAGFVIGVSEHRSHPVQLDPLAAGTHLLLYGDTASGKTTVLRRLLRYLGSSATAAAVHLIDPSRSLIGLAESATTYAGTANLAEKLAATLASELSERLPPENATIAELQGGLRWKGPQHVLVIDDYDLIGGQLGSPLAPLAELVAYSADVGLHVICARRIAGSGRASFEGFTQRLRDLRPPTLVFSGTADEGPITAGVTPRPLPRGRAIYLTPTAGAQLVQCCQPDPPACP
jgi:S-DNA-T family DNA segregation ATPase FtsK/SpoIIIE